MFSSLSKQTQKSITQVEFQAIPSQTFFLSFHEKAFLCLIPRLINPLPWLIDLLQKLFVTPTWKKSFLIASKIPRVASKTFDSRWRHRIAEKWTISIFVEAENNGRAAVQGLPTAGYSLRAAAGLLKLLIDR